MTNLSKAPSKLDIFLQEVIIADNVLIDDEFDDGNDNDHDHDDNDDLGLSQKLSL